MSRYRYNSQCQPPAPFVFVSITCQETRQELGPLPAQIDTAADRTVLPTAIAEQLQLVPNREIQVEGLGSSRSAFPTFFVEIRIHELEPVIRVEALAVPEEPWILLGRDVLNLFRLSLDGPIQNLDIE